MDVHRSNRAEISSLTFFSRRILLQEFNQYNLFVFTLSRPHPLLCVCHYSSCLSKCHSKNVIRFEYTVSQFISHLRNKQWFHFTLTPVRFSFYLCLLYFINTGILISEEFTYSCTVDWWYIPSILQSGFMSRSVMYETLNFHVCLWDSHFLTITLYMRLTGAITVLNWYRIFVIAVSLRYMKQFLEFLTWLTDTHVVQVTGE